MASLAPVDAPLGTITPAVRRFSNTTLHATVGTPLESKTWIALIDLIFEPGETNGDSLSQKESAMRDQERKETESQFLSDDGLKELQEVFNSKVDLKSIKSIKESDNV